MLPINIFNILPYGFTNVSYVPIPSTIDAFVSGVDVVIVSISYGFKYPPLLIIVDANIAIINSLPTRAGLNIFFPNPPNNIFPIIDETSAPSITIVIGVFNGSISPKNSPGKIL